MNLSPQKTKRDYLAAGLFWSWNVIFLAFMTLGFAPRILPDLFVAVSTRIVPIQFLFYALVLASIPLIAVILGFTVLRRAPRKLFALGYVVEGPLMLLLVVRFFVIRQASPGLVMLLSYAGLGMAAFLWYLLYPQVEKRGLFSGWLRLIGLSMMVLTSLYAAIWIAFYAVPLAAEVVKWLGQVLGDLPDFWDGISRSILNIQREELVWVPFALLGFLLLIYTATLFVLAPIAIPLLSLKAWWRSLRALVGPSGWLRPVALVILTVIASAALFVAANNQPQGKTFELLREPPATQGEAQALLDQQQFIRTGLLNAYLAPFRYISATGEVIHISDIYEGSFNLDHQDAFRVQMAYESVARPLLYTPVHAQDLSKQRDNFALVEDPSEAAELYQSFFDQTIIEGERETIVRAVRSSWSANQVEAAWQAVDDREVHLQRQEINVKEHGDWADIELLEVYQNQTAERQEVVYYFNLPESAVLTGVWLGNSEDRASRFAPVVSPRGAAQATYRNEKRLRIDPALLEQIGPRQYRLRVFPIPPVQMNWNDNNTRRTVEEAQPLYLWLNYSTVASQDAWPLPQLAEKRNVYWDRDSTLSINGAATIREGDTWLPESVPVTGQVTQQAHRFDLPGERTVIAVPSSEVELPALPDNLRIAIVLDRSRSMAVYEQQVSDTLVHLEQLMGPQTDTYLTSSPYRGEAPSLISLGDLDADSVVYFGGQNPAELLDQFEQLRANRDYDAVVVLSDGSGYELGESQVELPSPSAQVWIVHMDSDIPLGYDDPILEYIQASGGGVVGGIDQALERLALSISTTSSQPEESTIIQDVVDGYVWTVQPTVLAQESVAEMEFAPNDGGFEQIAARRLVLAEVQNQRGHLDDLQVLDAIHALAKETNIVTPYSSMIVLVTPTQQKRLEQLEQSDARFEREYEPVGETVPLNPLPLGGVPEPHEWLLLGLAAAFLIYYTYTKKFAHQQRKY